MFIKIIKIGGVIVVIVVGGAILYFFRHQISAGSSKVWRKLQTGYQPKPATTHKETVIDVN